MSRQLKTSRLPVEKMGSNGEQHVEKPNGIPKGSQFGQTQTPDQCRTTFLIPLTIHNESHSVWS